MRRIHIVDKGYELGAETKLFLKQEGFIPCYDQKLLIVKGDIVFGRWGLSKLNKTNPTMLDGVAIGCPMTNTAHLASHITKSPLFVKLNPSDATLKKVRSSSEYTFLLTLMAIKSVIDLSLAENSVKLFNRTEQWISTSHTMLEFKDAVVSFVGMGRNGQITASMLEAIGCTCRYYDPFIDLKLSHRRAVETLSEVFMDTDCVVLTLTSSDKTRNLINFDELTSRSANLSIINTSRPEVIEENSLYRALCEKRVKRYLSDFPLIDKDLMALVEADNSIKSRFFWSNHIGGASKRSALIADDIVIKAVLR